MMFEQELTALLNRYAVENESDTPDFILAEYLCSCLRAWNAAVKQRDHFKRGKNEISNRTG